MPRLLSALRGRWRLLRAVVAAGTAAPGPMPAPLVPDGAVTVHRLDLGDTPIELVERRCGSAGWTYLNLHENESTSVQAAVALLAEGVPGRLLQLRAQGRRLVTFRAQGRRHAFDPNRVFSEAGIAATLQRHGCDSPAARSLLRGFAAAVLAHLDGAPQAPVVALHNGGLGQYAIDSYRPGASHAGDARALHVAPGCAGTDFFLVTAEAHHRALAEAGFHSVWQATAPHDDGSLSVWCARTGRAYVNVEAQHGHADAQLRMLRAVAALPPAG